MHADAGVSHVLSSPIFSPDDATRRRQGSIDDVSVSSPHFLALPLAAYGHTCVRDSDASGGAARALAFSNTLARNSTAASATSTAVGRALPLALSSPLLAPTHWSDDGLSSTAVWRAPVAGAGLGPGLSASLPQGGCDQTAATPCTGCDDNDDDDDIDVLRLLATDPHGLQWPGGDDAT